MKYRLLIILFFLTLQLRSQADFVLVLDAGHGGLDPGKLCSDCNIFKYERDIALAITLKIGHYVEKHLDNVKVIYTRIDDRSVSLEERALIANTNNANLLLSIHCNSNPNPTIFGTQMHIQENRFVDSFKMAQIINWELKHRAKRKTKGILNRFDRGHNLYLLQYTKMPSVLLELGFMSNPEEERYLNSEYGQDILASAVFRAIRTFIKETKGQ